MIRFNFFLTIAISFLVLIPLKVFGNSYDFALFPPTTIEEACKRSKCIYVVTYKSFSILDSKAPVYRNLFASYIIHNQLKGQKSQATDLKIEYEISEDPNYTPPEKWKFSKKVMPKPGSKWILFVTYNLTDGSMCTYRGSYGRMPHSEELENDIKNRVRSERFDVEPKS
ncbi:MAG: hypothetical protein SFY67_05380 [Candidatus Melainabacteria bacterium]|nr:hypothetical protein [Candidatus Melainabacteria bacterium]